MTTMTTVRPMRDDERDEVRALLTEVYLPYSTNMSPTMYQHYLAGVLAIDDGGDTVVAVADGTVIGTARFFPVGRVPVPLPPDWAWVRAVGVHPSARGTGVGRALMAHCDANVGAASALALHTMDFMPAAVRLYERLGYDRAPEWDIVVGAKSGFPHHERFTAVAYRLVR